MDPNSRHSAHPNCQTGGSVTRENLQNVNLTLTPSGEGKAKSISVRGSLGGDFVKAIQIEGTLQLDTGAWELSGTACPDESVSFPW